MVCSKLIDFDFMSEKVSLENNGSKVFKSPEGACISLTIVISSIVLTVFFGKEIIERKTPIVSSTQNYIKDSKFDLVEFPIYFAISNTTGHLIPNYNDFFHIHGVLLNRTNSIPDYNNPFRYNVSRLCNDSDFEVLKKFISTEKILEIKSIPLICLNFDKEAVIKNNFAFLNSSYVNVMFNYIGNENKKNEFYVRSFFINNYIDSMDFEEPVKFYIDSYVQQVSNGSLRRNFIKFTMDEFKSDNGWLLEDIKLNKFISFHSMNVEINAVPSSFPNAYYWVTIVSPQIRKINFRSFLKIQELAAKIGGLINAFVITTNILFYHYFRYKYVHNIAKKVYEGDIRSIDFLKKYDISSQISILNNNLKRNVSESSSNDDINNKNKNNDRSNNNNNENNNAFKSSKSFSFNKKYFENIFEYKSDSSKPINIRNLDVRSNENDIINDNILSNKESVLDINNIKDESNDNIRLQIPKISKNKVGFNLNKDHIIYDNENCNSNNNNSNDNNLKNQLRATIHKNFNGIKSKSIINTILERKDELDKNSEIKNHNEIIANHDSIGYIDYLLKDISVVCCFLKNDRHKEVTVIENYTNENIDFFEFVKKLRILSYLI